MFVREPYHRLWSAYVDKFLLPDLWHIDGKNILRHRDDVASEPLERTRTPALKTKQKESQHCSNDVTFAEFLDYVGSAERPSELNEHYRPYHFLCSPCLFRPHVIGKMETFAEDSRNVLRQLNVSWAGKKVILEGREEENKTTHARDLHEMVNLINDNFYEIRSSTFFKGCINNTGLARRLWRTFQINGYLPRDVSAPLRPGQEVTRKQFQHLVFAAYGTRKVTSKQFWRDQKTRAFAEAYREVPDAVLEKVRTVFSMDFKLFDYDPYPELLYSYRKRSAKS